MGANTPQLDDETRAFIEADLSASSWPATSAAAAATACRARMGIAINQCARMSPHAPPRALEGVAR